MCQLLIEIEFDKFASCVPLFATDVDKTICSETFLPNKLPCFLRSATIATITRLVVARLRCRLFAECVGIPAEQ